MGYGGVMYILRCADDTLYVGSTRNLEGRLWQHQNGDGTSYTRRRLPVELAYAEAFDTVDSAYLREKQIQGWSRAKREALIAGRLDELKSNMVSTWKQERDAERAERRRRFTQPG